jgi:hypothetical protein
MDGEISCTKRQRRSSVMAGELCVENARHSRYLLQNLYYTQMPGTGVLSVRSGCQFEFPFVVGTKTDPQEIRNPEKGKPHRELP